MESERGIHLDGRDCENFRIVVLALKHTTKSVPIFRFRKELLIIFEIFWNRFLSVCFVTTELPTSNWGYTVKTPLPI
jgi:hypothetical protein